MQFAAEHYDVARRLFEDAYALSGRKRLLYNIALSADRQGDTKAALAAYDEFLASEPQSERAAEVRRRVRTLRAEEARAAKVPPPSAVAAAAAATDAGSSAASATEFRTDKQPLYKKWWFWTGVSVVVVGGVIAAVALADGGHKEASPFEGRTGVTVMTLGAR